MFSLVYPLDSAPLLGTKTKRSEILPIVEPNGLVVGRASRKYCHGGSMALHPVVHLHIIRRDGALYLQRRGMDKELLPGYWDTAVGGHVPYGEQIEEALFREAFEELNFADFNPVMLRTYEFDGRGERELVTVFATITARTPKPDGYEVSEGRWWTPAELKAAMGTDVLTPNFESEYTRIQSSLEALL